MNKSEGFYHKMVLKRPSITFEEENKSLITIHHSLEKDKSLVDHIVKLYTNLNVYLTYL